MVGLSRTELTSNPKMFMLLCCLYSIFLTALELHRTSADEQMLGYLSAVGDPGMRNDNLRVAIEAWNQCNEVGEEAMNMGSPRLAECFDVDNSSFSVRLIHRVSESDNKLGILNGSYGGIEAKNMDLYAVEKELYLGSKCEVRDKPRPWQFWMVMLKNGNTDTLASKCPKNGKPASPFPPSQKFPCFGEGCMNMPLMFHTYTTVGGSDNTTLTGGFYGTWDLDTNGTTKGIISNDSSYYSVKWEKKLGEGSWVFHHMLKTSSKYPWLMLYLRADASIGFSAGYHYETRGMMKITPKSPNFIVKFRLEVKKGGGDSSQFYLMDMGSCWKNNGKPCDGNVTTDVTRYSEMIINPDATPVCSRSRIGACPPYHTFPNGTRVHRMDTFHFPYDAYHYHCIPGNAVQAESPYEECDPYSNPQAQEILQILPHPVWRDYGYPTEKGQGWVGDPRNWELDVGRLSQSLYFYQDPGTQPTERYWTSLDLGTEIYISAHQVAEWTVSDFDIIVPKNLN